MATVPLPSVPIRPASTLVLLRDGEAGLEVFMLRRSQSAAFLGGAYVFPGGALDRQDHEPHLHARVVGVSEAEANERLGIGSGALAYWVAALRECFEEAGILLASDEGGNPLAGQRLAAVLPHRAALNRGDASFAQLLELAGALLPAHELVYFDHWITPAGRPRRFDTRFFMARAPLEQEGLHDASETIDSAWLRPADALARAERSEMELAHATRTLLRQIARHESAAHALEWARERRRVEATRPVVAQGRSGPTVFGPNDAPYAEIRWSDPQETTHTTYDMLPDVPKALDARVTRIVAGNPGMMTGPGTNTYLVGDDALTVVDPGPPLDAHVQAILAAGGDRIRRVVCTHTHRDHSPAAQALREATGAEVIGLPAPPGTAQDAAFKPDRMPADGERFVLGGTTLRALHTPGHASNHVCYLLEETGMLFTGDHVMQGSTVVINPPDGDMAIYLRSLGRVVECGARVLAPGHGYLIGEPARAIDRLVSHRLAREAKVVAALSDGPATLDALVPRVYDDTPQNRWTVAARSLLAHLLKLEQEGRVTEADGRYALRGG